MKKISILFALAILFQINVAQADSLTFSQKEFAAINKQVSEVGFNLLNSSGVEKRMAFSYNADKTINATTSYHNRMITMYRGLYSYLESNDELAAVLAHEISHGIDSYDGILRGTFSNLSYVCSPKKYEYKADKKAVDLMVNAGYNPVAMIVVMQKSFPQGRFDWHSTHPLTTRRTMEVYEYIYKKYPEYLAKNIYKNNIYYQNFLLTSKENRAKFQKKIETKSKGRVSYL